VYVTLAGAIVGTTRGKIAMTLNNRDFFFSRDDLLLILEEGMGALTASRVELIFWEQRFSVLSWQQYLQRLPRSQVT
jgi:hypothetical protein